MIRGQLEAEELAKKGQFAQAEGHMSTISEGILEMGYEQIAVAARTVGSHLNNIHNYTTSQGFLRSFANSGTRSYGTSSLDAEAESVLFACAAAPAAANAAMESYTSAFIASDEDKPEATPLIVPLLLQKKLKK